ncbi:phosphoenolpyruvate carboxylase [Dyadobacter sediminis]|uniref:Phosphoenolpyruvate carboxylase n=1 Tax=Dyadobacter sediminis TaxID=1493691 RepID=A0A5R9K5Y0_9BACT|nr:phosphoenolpyruvate carboxylase [Dyadobacter sediminis]TLU89066.1 phosphoenolpyruvate carboxylase [Dyadobacter sediminis]GGC03077.1 phosphoenolpyruvate carboxylase [Dyadobacter sediminis]
MNNSFQDAVVTKYNIFNSLFLSLPYRGIFQTGSLLPILTQQSETGFQEGKSPKEIIEHFFSELLETATPKERADLLFAFIQYIERQVVLFDSVEDAAFDLTHDLTGKGSVNYLTDRLDSEELKKKLLAKLEDFSVRIVLTAHPTQFYSGKVLGIINDLEDAIKKNDFTEVNQLLLQLGKTAFINHEKPTPFDEAVSLCWFLENVYYDAIPSILEKLINGLGMSVHDWPYPNVYRLGFWPGGDRDGNPFVNPEITLQVAARLRETLLRGYYRDLRTLRRRLTFKGVDEAVALAERKMNSTIFGPFEEGYSNAQELIDELLKSREVLVSKHQGLFVELLDNFILKLNIFGFFFASLDVRQDSRKHAKAWEDILKRLEKKVPLLKYSDYESWDEAKKIDLLLSLNIPLRDEDYEDELTKDILGSIRAIKTIQHNNGEKGAHRYVISNNTSALNVMQVVALAKNLIADEEGKLALDVVPLFETVDDLANAPGIMRQLYENEYYRNHLNNRENHQTIMVGFSDGTKDGGYLRANWSIYRAKEELTQVSREFGIKVTFFDGRGGPPARGGGNNHNFYSSLGKDIEDKEIQLTVQGQTISSNYGTVTTAMYNLERLFTAGLENHLFRGSRVEEELSENDKVLIEQMAEAAYNSYLDLKNHPMFVKYLDKKTPLRFYGQTNIGSRPTKRGNDDEGLKFEDLRAIPFVGSWAQMKQNVPGFYGFGTAIQQLIEDGRKEDIIQLYKKSLFFRTLIENSMQSLSKAFFPATKYLRDEEDYTEFWDKMYNEFLLTRDLLLEVSAQKELLDSNNITKVSIKTRERIVLPLITIQQYALQMLAQDSKTLPVDVETYNQLIMRAMFGIINAARNSA